METITISNQIIEVLEYLCNKFGIVCDWTASTIIPVVESLMGKYIKWEIASSTVWGVMGIAVIVGGIILLKQGVKIKNDPSSGFMEETGWLIGGSSAVVIGFVVFMVAIFTIVKCVTFPELQAIEYAKSLMNTLK